MSDPVKNAEVEDVLSSIRRLVSEDKRPLQTPPVANDAPAVEARDPAPAAERLVLTPALRVEDEAPEAQAEAPQADVQPLILTPDLQEAEENASDDQEAVTDVAANVAEVVEVSEATPEEAPEIANDNNAEDAVAEISADQPEAQPAVDLSEDYQADPYNFDDANDADGEGGPVPQAEASPVPDTASPTDLTAKIAALETAIGDISDEWEPDGKSVDAYAGKETAAMAWVDDTDAEEATPVSARTEAIRDAIADEVRETAMPQVEEAVEQAIQDELEGAPLEEGGDSDVADETPPETPQTPEPETETAEQGDTLDLAASEEQMLDEDTLRDMISGIVQTELQGALGERITRNVRRLVRREIHRALTARDLD